jgi:hypothetical protein
LLRGVDSPTAILGRLIWQAVSACNRDIDAWRKFFGLLVWKYTMEHEDTWSFGRYDIRGVAVEGLAYFKIDR